MFIWIMSIFFNFYIARYSAVDIKNALLDQGEFIQKSYIKAVLENKYTIRKYCTIFMEEFFSVWWI